MWQIKKMLIKDWLGVFKKAVNMPPSVWGCLLIKSEVRYGSINSIYFISLIYLSFTQKVGEPVLGDEDDVDEKELSCLRLLFPFA